VRISLVEREPEPGKQRKRRKKKKRVRTFDSAVARPQALSDSRTKKRRTPAKRAASRRRPRSRKAGTRAVAVDRAGSWWRIALARLLAIALLLGAIGMLVYGSVDARFFVYQAQVTGAHHIDATTIYRQAGIDEQNIFWIRPAQVAQRLQQIDGIAAAQVHTSLPARVSIEVQEREPVLMWRAMAQQRDWWLDGEGRVLPYPGDAQSPDMIFVVDSSDRQLEQGGNLRPPDLVDSVRQLAAALPRTRIFFYDGDRELSFTQQVDGSEWPVYVGTSDDLPRKIQVLQVLDRYLQDNQIRPRYVDVRWADHPVYNVPGGGTTGEGE
jgi:cell division septal protein FtsQ